MTDNPKLEVVDSLNLTSPEEMRSQKISFSDRINGLQYTSTKSESFVVDMERFYHPNDIDITANSGITRSLSRKGSQRSGEKKINSSTGGNDRDTTGVAANSPKVALDEATMHEKRIVVTAGTINHSINPEIHHPTTSITCNIGSATTESKLRGNRFSFRRSSPSWAIDPRRILFFFATLSSMGTILLIYFTLSTSKLSVDDSVVNS